MVAVLACACSDGSRDEIDIAAAAIATKAPVMAERTEAVLPSGSPLPLYPPHVRSLRLRRSVSVRYQPGEETKRLGTVARDTRVLWRSSARGPGCSRRWIELEPRGWVCEIHLEPSTREPHGVELPKLSRYELVPGSYGKVNKGAKAVTIENGLVVSERVIAGNATVRQLAELELAGTSYWRIGPSEYVRSSDISVHEPSDYQGIRLGDDTGHSLPMGFAVGKVNPYGRVPVYSDSSTIKAVGRVPARTPVSILEQWPTDGAATAYRIDEDRWLAAGDVRVIEQTAPPPHTGYDERWIDVDLDDQVLVAYEGTTPVYATLVSSGKRKTPTETGVYRVWIKFAETTMSGGMGEDDAYSVATVPWTQFYAIDLALHTTYWHDKLGVPRSHGCINLAPRDARFLYFWSAPDVPRGWSMAHGIFERPGSLVRVRSAADPAPELKGYAARVAEARQSSSSR